MIEHDEQYWKNKLLAFLHDPPHKCLDIYKHEEMAKSFMLSAGFLEGEINGFKKDADHTAYAIDRFSFPQKVCTAKFTGQENETFKHPFCKSEYKTKIKSAGVYNEYLQDAFGGIGTVDGDAKSTFFLYWRRWMENTTAIKGGSVDEIALFPADTRIPDHTIWTHLSVTSALEGCRNTKGIIKPAFLIFQAGPVQDFIAAARSTRDLWSGSYMLSWLTGNAMKAITDQIGPDSMIFPALRGLGIFDILNKDTYESVSYTGREGKSETLWQRLYDDGSIEDKKKNAERLLNPAMPNRFFAIVPEEQAEDLAKAAEQAFRDAYKEIANHCWKRFLQHVESIDSTLNVKDWKVPWDKQVELLPEITWQVMPVEKDIEQIKQKVEQLPAMQEEKSSLKTIKALIKLATETIPKDDRDSRYYTSVQKDTLNNWGITWSLNYALCDYALAARRNTRDFVSFKTDSKQDGASKDMLTGKEEIIGTPEFWGSIPEKDSFFNKNEGPYGSTSIIKRFWCRGDHNYLFGKLGINESIFNQVVSADSVPDVAKKNNLTGNDLKKKREKSSNPYVAVIALDGDSMGKWMSGEKAPSFLQQISGKAPDYFKGLKIGDDLLRPLTPSYHLQFSESLANFANHIAGKVIKHCDGQLIYAGGDDVLAMIPATKAIHCVQLLRAAFRGDSAYLQKMSDANKLELDIPNDGFIKVGLGYPLIMPGMDADVSCGIAIAHKNYPLQRMVKEAQIAEKRAKNEYNRGALAVSLLKRGGEIVHWGCKWHNGSLNLFNTYNDLRKDGKVSARFPYALAQFLAPYELEKEEFIDSLDIKSLIASELSHVLGQQVTDSESRKTLQEASEIYLQQVTEGYGEEGDKKIKWGDFVKLFLTAAFIERERGE